LCKIVETNLVVFKQDSLPTANIICQCPLSVSYLINCWPTFQPVGENPVTKVHDSRCKLITQPQTCRPHCP